MFRATGLRLDIRSEFKFNAVKLISTVHPAPETQLDLTTSVIQVLNGVFLFGSVTRRLEFYNHFILLCCLIALL